MPGRSHNDSLFRFGFNNKEKENETYGQGNEYDYGFRIYNPRLGKFLSIDRLTSKYAWYTPYQFSGNKPTFATDLDGNEPNPYTKLPQEGEQDVRRDAGCSVPFSFFGVQPEWKTTKFLISDRLLLLKDIFYLKAFSLYIPSKRCLP